MDHRCQHIPDVFDIEQLGRLVRARLGVQPASALLEEFLAEVTAGGSVAAYLEQLSGPKSTVAWSGAPATHLLTHETYFFRNKGHWEALRRSVLPELRRRLEADGAQLRIWSAGCASGEEPLSIAMVLLDMESAHLLGRGRIVATDVSDASLARARQGKYAAKALQCTPADVAGQHLEERSGEWTVRPGVTELVRYQRLNLADRVAVDDFIANEGPFHIVFCRNVLIYFHVELCRRLLGQFATALHQEGTLFLGHAEFPQMWSDAFESRYTSGTIVWRHRSPARDAGPERASGGAAGWAQLAGRLPDAEPESGRLQERASPCVGKGAAACEPAPERPPAATRCVAAVPDTGSCNVWPGVLEVLRHVKFSRNGEAVSAARRLVEDQQLVPEAHYVLGLALEASGQSECAIGAYRNAIFLDADFAQAHWRLGLTLAAIGQRGRAIAAVHWAIKLMPTEHDARVQRLSDIGRGELTRTMERTSEWLLKQTS